MRIGIAWGPSLIVAFGLKFNTIETDMIYQWSDNNKTSWNLWDHEWYKHGSCSLKNLYINDSNDYFISALWINMRLNDKLT